MQQMICPNHGPAPISYSWLAPLAGASSMGALTNHISKGDPYLTLAGVLLGLWTGAQAAKHCPQCGAVLQVVDDINLLWG